MLFVTQWLWAMGYDHHVGQKVSNRTSWCEEILLVQTKIRALSQARADTERMFSLMNFIKSKLTSRIGKSLGHRMRAQAHVPREPALVDWDYAFKIWQEKKRYQKEMPGTKSFKDKKKLKGLQMSLLNL